MLIGIDGNEANVMNRVGIGEYAYELLVEFYRLKQIAIRHDYDALTFKIYLKYTPLADMPEETEWWKYEIVKPAKLWTQVGLPIKLFLEKLKPDVFFTPSHYAPRFALIPTVISIMDLSYMHFPELFDSRDLYQLKHWTAYSVKQASKLFTISESSKNDILKEYKVPADRVIVTYPGVKMNMKGEIKHKEKAQSPEEKYGFSHDYILFVGTLQPRKNIVRLIEAFSKIWSQKADFDLVIVGKKGWLYEDILTAAEKFGIKDSVKFLDFVPDQDLPLLYEHAMFYVLPSLYEGFGLPVLEAMKYGCPVITSNVSSLPEAGGDAVLYVDPTNVSDIAEKMQMLTKDSNLRETMRAKGFLQVKKFSWEKTAKETLKVLEEVAVQKK